MSVCSSISSGSSCGSRMLYGNSNGDLSARNKQPYQRSRPGIQRSDHTAASVLELDGSRHSILSLSTGASAYFPNLVRKESVRSICSSICQTKNQSKSHLVPSSLSIKDQKGGCKMKSRNGRKRVVRFAPPSEILWIPISSLVEMSSREVAATWYSSKEYDEQRIHDSNIVFLMEQELENSSTMTLGAVVRTIEGSRGLEQRTTCGERRCKRNRQNSIKAVLTQQDELSKERSFLIEYNEWNNQKEKQFEHRLASMYCKQTESAKQDALKRAKYDAKEAVRGKSACVPSAKSKYSHSRPETHHQPLAESLHTLSSQRDDRQPSLSPRKRRHDRPLPPLRDLSIAQYPSVPSLIYDSLSSSSAS
jgi:hypothetical protein